MVQHGKLTRIGLFLDGSFLYMVSNFFRFQHSRGARIDLAGLADFVRERVATNEGSARQYCQIVETHYFRGRLPAKMADERGQLYDERSFDDVLLALGITAHYTLMAQDQPMEKGVDVSLALEAYDLAVRDHIDICVLFTGDGDFVPLVRRLNGLGVRVMIIGCRAQLLNGYGDVRSICTAQTLLNEATYPVLLNELVDDPAASQLPEVKKLFLTNGCRFQAVGSASAAQIAREPGERLRGTILSVGEAEGVVKVASSGQTLMFDLHELVNGAPQELVPGTEVEFDLRASATGPEVRNITLLEVCRYDMMTATAA